jgi:hypothetical protein
MEVHARHTGFRAGLDPDRPEVGAPEPRTFGTDQARSPAGRTVPGQAPIDPPGVYALEGVDGCRPGDAAPALALIVDEITNAGQRDWWGSHSLTTDTVSGLRVLLITVLVVNQLLSMGQDRQRSHAVGAQAAIVVAQAEQSAGAVSSVTGGSGDRGAASDLFGRYMMMLLTSTPVFIEDPVGRRFLEQAQDLGAVMGDTLELAKRSTGGAAVPGDRLDDAMQQLRSAAAPLLQPLKPEVRQSIDRIGRTTEK